VIGLKPIAVEQEDLLGFVAEEIPGELFVILEDLSCVVQI